VTTYGSESLSGEVRCILEIAAPARAITAEETDSAVSALTGSLGSEPEASLSSLGRGV
jgi:hypothetical protein